MKIIKFRNPKENHGNSVKGMFQLKLFLIKIKRHQLNRMQKVINKN